ncbi:MAG: patatin-like phospholipase family protein [Roseiarcus sp.]
MSEITLSTVPCDSSGTKVRGAAAPAEASRQTILVFQGGGALGAYQVGVYQALHEAGVEPDWVIGTSIGAINASLIAGNRREDRLDQMNAFWKRVQNAPCLAAASNLPWLGAAMPNLATLLSGISGFFQPNLLAFLGLNTPLASEAAGYYSTLPLRATLDDLVDFSVLNSGVTRLTVGAANVRTGAMRYFDSREEEISCEHIIASGALPPAFPPVRIDGELYWDGGILSNTPVEAVFDDNPRRNSLVFSVHLWNSDGAEPRTMGQIINRQKDLQYSSRTVTHIKRQKQIHCLRHIIAELAARLPDVEQAQPDVLRMAAYGCLTRMHVVRLLAPTIQNEDHTKDIDFSRSGIRERREAGYADTCRVLEQKPWEGDYDPLEGFVLHAPQEPAVKAPTIRLP